MMKKNLFIYFLLIFCLANVGFAQSFGKNKVRYDDFKWSYIQTENFDIYFYEGGKDLATFAAPIAEEQIRRITNILNWRMRKRTALLIYNSHSDFQQTNVILDYLTEGTGGFTELFKNRAVVAFDGNYHGFWHVVRHELLHVVINDMIYGGNIQSVISGRVRLRIPLWMHEGFAEYISMGWDTHADLIIRDIALNNDIPDIKDLDYYMAYKGGQSVYRYIADKYGVEKIGEIWSQMKGRKDLEKGFKAAIGMDTKELTEKWHRWVRNLYWPDIADRNELGEIATKLTDHKELKNYFNTSPAVSPNGGTVAIMSDRKGYADIYLISSIDGKVIKKVLSGQKTPDLEELKWLNPRLSWSPDGENIVLAVKSGKTDALIVVNTKTKKIKKFTFDSLEEIFSAAWSPDGKSIAFVGLQNDCSDIYLYYLEEGKLERLTSDKFSDFEPAWSPDSKRIVFATQRGTADDEKNILSDAALNEYNYHQTDLFIYDLETREIVRLTDTPWNENCPVWANKRNTILCTSDAGGISNLHSIDLDNGESAPLTNVLTGIFQPSLSKDDSRLMFAGYVNSGWDIYSISNPLSLAEIKDGIKPTVFARELKAKWDNPEEYEQLSKPSPDDIKSSYTQNIDEDRSFSNYIFAPGYEYEDFENSYTAKDTTEAISDTIKYKSKDGNYVVNRYKTKFTLDLIDSQAGYSTFWGFQGTTIFAFSDVLGNHRFIFGTEMYVDLENSDYYLYYQYLTKRINYSIMGFHSANFYALSYTHIWRLRNYGADISISRPFSKFSRLELGTTSYNVEQNLIDVLLGKTVYKNSIHTILPRVALVYDNTLWGYFYPMDGCRFRLDYIMSPQYEKSSIDFKTIKMDLRRYFKLNREYSFGLRLSAGVSEGKNAQRFFLGGEMNWLNQKYRRYHDFDNVEDIYFAEFVTPLRGARYYEREGTRYFLTNFEFRYPFIKYLSLGWPIPLKMGGIQGVTFLDMGSAWSNNDLHMFGRTESGGLKMDDLVAGFGIGTRLFFGYFLLKIDIAWRFDLTYVSRPKYYFSLGTDF